MDQLGFCFPWASDGGSADEGVLAHPLRQDVLARAERHAVAAANPAKFDAEFLGQQAA